MSKQLYWWHLDKILYKTVKNTTTTTKECCLFMQNFSLEKRCGYLRDFYGGNSFGSHRSFRECQSCITVVSFRKPVFKRATLFLPVFQSRYSDKAGLCWKGEEINVKLNAGGIIWWKVWCCCEHLSTESQIWDLLKSMKPVYWLD